MHLAKYKSIKNFIILIILVIGAWQFGSGSYIYAKAHLAQYLLNNAWSKTLQGEKKVKPWNWADTYPIAKLTFVKSKQSYLVLEGGTGRTMAFGPGHLSASPLPGNGGNSVIVGHRDTHFKMLKNLTLNDKIHVEIPDKQVHYRVIDSFIVDQSQIEVMQDYGIEQLTLITCYPFDTLRAGGPLRYVVQAESI